MAHNEGKLPWELIEEILSRVPPKSLVRFRTVAKQWNTLFDDKTFIKNHKTTFRFILTTMSKVYSVSIDPELVVRELTLDVSGLEYKIPNNLVDCNEFLVCGFYKRTAVWNPWLEQSTWIKSEVNQTSIEFNGIGYDHNSRVEERVYKTIASYRKESDPIKTCWKVQDFASDTWKDIESESDGTSQGEKRDTLHSSIAVSLNGTLYWIAFCDETDPFYHLINFDFSADMFYSFCNLPCGIKHYRDALVLGVFRGDRFSLLKQCHVAKKIEIWVTKNKIDCEDGDDVVWMSFMTLSIPNFPSLVHPGSRSHPSYFIEDKRLVVCSCDETGRAWIYVVEEDKLISSIRIDSVVERWPLNCTYFPSLVPVPRVQREEA